MQIPNGKPLKALMSVFGKKKKNDKNKNKRKEADMYWLKFVLFILEETLCVVTVGVPSTKTLLVVSWQVISQILCTGYYF